MTDPNSIETIVRTMRAERFDVDAPGHVATPSSRASLATIANLSVSGCLVRTPAPAAVGDHVTISLRGIGMSQAVVVRTTEDGFGCAFLMPLRPQELRRAVAEFVNDEHRAAAAVRTLRQNLRTGADPAVGLLARLKALRRPTAD